MLLWQLLRLSLSQSSYRDSLTPVFICKHFPTPVPVSQCTTDISPCPSSCSLTLVSSALLACPSHFTCFPTETSSENLLADFVWFSSVLLRFLLFFHINWLRNLCYSTSVFVNDSANFHSLYYSRQMSKNDHYDECSLVPGSIHKCMSDH